MKKRIEYTISERLAKIIFIPEKSPIWAAYRIAFAMLAQGWIESQMPAPLWLNRYQ